MEYKFYKPLLDLFVFFVSENYKTEMESLQFLTNISDLSMPHQWFPEARQIKRTIVYHLGPTNSGKTHQALQALKEARTGIYLAPLRLLAWEVLITVTLY